MNPIPGQANTRTRSLVARADGTPITAGTVNYYLIALTGDNAGKWFRTSDDSWQAAEAIAAVMSHKADGHWTCSVDSAAWTDGVEYTEYAKEDGDLHVPTSAMIRCGVVTAAAVVTALLADSSWNAGSVTIAGLFNVLGAYAAGNIGVAAGDYAYAGIDDAATVLTITPAADARTVVVA